MIHPMPHETFTADCAIKSGDPISATGAPVFRSPRRRSRSEIPQTVIEVSLRAQVCDFPSSVVKQALSYMKGHWDSVRPQDVDQALWSVDVVWCAFRLGANDDTVRQIIAKEIPLFQQEPDLRLLLILLLRLPRMRVFPGDS